MAEMWRINGGYGGYLADKFLNAFNIADMIPAYPKFWKFVRSMNDSFGIGNYDQLKRHNNTRRRLKNSCNFAVKIIKTICPCQ